MNDIEKRYINVFSVEVLERAIRLISLVENSSLFARASTLRVTAQTSSAEQIKKLVSDLVIREMLVLFPSTKPYDSQLRLLHSFYETVVAIHEYALPTAPRPIEPIELKSFFRQSSCVTGITSPIHVFASDRLGIQTFPDSMASAIKQFSNSQKSKAIAEFSEDKEDLKSYARFSLKESSQVEPIEENYNKFLLSIAIPAIDIHNPNRWPSLFHELGHHKLGINPEENLILKFIDFVSEDTFIQICDDLSLLSAPLNVPLVEDNPEGLNSETLMSRSRSKILITNWLKECWCDAFGVKCGGLAFLYAQLHDFMFCFPNYLSSTFTPGQIYPPASFRLRLAHILAFQHLKTSSDLTTKLIAEYKEEEETFKNIVGLDKQTEEFPNEFSSLHKYFLDFLKAEFVFNNDEFGGLLNESAMNQLDDDLKQGLPIPSIFNEENHTERAAGVSEILLSGWRHRNVSIRQEIIETFDDISSKADINKVDDFNELMEDLTQNVTRKLRRSDECIKRSIQVSEWFESLSPKDLNTGIVTAAEPIPESSDTGLLSDVQIKSFLRSKKLRVVPLISADDQLNGSVIDLRLGHNFEIFHPSISGVIDPCSEISSEDRIDSMQLEIDVFDGVTIVPGQFLLSHTLEYIKLPDNVAAQIEGRSSFARLGLQVHMTANLVEAGFEGCLTLEILNSGSSSIKLYPGMRIAQLRFFQLSSSSDRPYDKKSKYRGQLSHNKAKQFSDREVKIFRSHRQKKENE